MEPTPVTKTADELLNELRMWELEQNPHGPVKTPEGFNYLAQTWNEVRRVSRDIKMAAVIEAIGYDAIKYVTVVREPKKPLVLIYNNFAADIGCSFVEWTTIPAAAQSNPGRIYMKQAKGLVEWRFRVLKGDYKKFLLFKLKDWLTKGKFKHEISPFAKDVAKLFKAYPHQDYNKWNKYFCLLMTILRPREGSNMTLATIVQEVAENLKYNIYKDDLDGMTRSDIFEKLREKSTIPSIADCSKNVQRLLLKYDPESVKADETLDDIMLKAREEEEKLSALDDEDELNEDPSLKRKREEDEEDTDEPAEKKLKTES